MAAGATAEEHVKVLGETLATSRRSPFDQPDGRPKRRVPRGDCVHGGGVRGADGGEAQCGRGRLIARRGQELLLLGVHDGAEQKEAVHADLQDAPWT